jgi:hypothetical protein
MTDKPDEDLVPTPEAARLLGVPEPDFTRLVRALGLEPARPGTRTQPRLWDGEVVRQLAASPEIDELRQSAVRHEQVRLLLAGLQTRYPEWRAALRPAADALFNFNRYSKWAGCSRLRRRELYDLKDKVIRIFYGLGLAREVLVHTAAGLDEDCPACEGTGKDWHGQDCPTCAGRGQVRSEEPREFLHFCFHIDGAWYNWHQPRKAVQWPVEITPPLTGAPERPEWRPGSPEGAEKRVYLTSDEAFLEAEAHLRFVLKKHEEEQELQRQEERRRRWEENRRRGLARRDGKTPDEPPS